MKKPILAMVLCMAIASVNAHATRVNVIEKGVPAKKTSPALHNILSDQLPVKLRTTIKKDYRSYWITGLYKEETNGKISYHITVENADHIIKMSATHTTNWSVVRVVPRDASAS